MNEMSYTTRDFVEELKEIFASSKRSEYHLSELKDHLDDILIKNYLDTLPDIMKKDLITELDGSKDWIELCTKNIDEILSKINEIKQRVEWNDWFCIKFEIWWKGEWKT